MKKPSFPTIHAEITVLKNRIKQYNLPEKIRCEARANNQHDSFKVSKAQFGLQPQGADERQLLLLRAEWESARDARVNAEKDNASDTREIERLNTLLTADDRGTRAKQQIEATTGLLAEAQTAEASAVAARAEIDTLVVAETQALETARGQAAVAVLSQVKAGTIAKLPAVNRERLATLQVAQEHAAAELIEAQEVLAECWAKRDAAHHEHAQALADGTARTLHVLSREYAAALICHKAAAYACGLVFDAPDLDFLVRQLENETDCE